jgi:hypothetical protein
MKRGYFIVIYHPFTDKYKDNSSSLLMTFVHQKKVACPKFVAIDI